MAEDEVAPNQYLVEEQMAAYLGQDLRRPFLSSMPRGQARAIFRRIDRLALFVPPHWQHSEVSSVAILAQAAVAAAAGYQCCCCC